MSTRAHILELIDRWIRFRCRLKGRDGEPRGLLLTRSGGLGDTILFSHLMPAYMRAAQGGEPVVVVTPKSSVKTTFLFPDGIEVIGVDYRRFQHDPGYRHEISEDLYRRNFRLCISTDHLRHPHVDEAMLFAAQAPKTVAMEARSWPKHDHALARNRRRFDTLFNSGPDRGSMVHRWADFAGSLIGEKPRACAPVLPDDRLAAPAQLERPTIVLQPFSAVRAKQPSPDLFRVMIERAQPDYDVVITGAPNDFDTNPEYKPLLEMPGVSFDSSTFEGVVPLLRAAKFVVSVDTALMHLAVAVGAPTLCPASAAYVEELVPYPEDLTPDNVHFVYHPMPCEGCRGACGMPLQDGMYPCIARLDRTEVLDAFDALLNAKDQRP